MEENMNKLNWPTAFVIVAIIFAGAFVYNKPTDAGLGSDAGMILKGHAGNYRIWQLRGGSLRTCYNHNPTGTRLEVGCTNWKNKI